MRWHWTFLVFFSALFWRPVASHVISHVPRDLRKTLRLVYRKQHDVLSVIFVIPLCNGSVEVKNIQYLHFKSADTAVCIGYSYKANKCNFLLLKYDFTAVCVCTAIWWGTGEKTHTRLQTIWLFCRKSAFSKPFQMKWNESGFKPPLCTFRLNWARSTSWGWWDDWDDTVLQTQDSKFEPWRSEAEHATSRSRRLPTILTFTKQAISAISVVRIYWRLLSINRQTRVQKPSLAASV